MPISRSRPPQEIKKPKYVNGPDRMIDPFTIPALEPSSYSDELKKLFREVMLLGLSDNPELSEIEFAHARKQESLMWLESHWYQAAQRVTAPDVLIAPNGQESVRNVRPDDFATQTDEPRTPMVPEKPYENSPFWHTNIENGCFPPLVQYTGDTPDDQDKTIAAAIPNSFPFMDPQELIVFPHTEAVSISQLTHEELKALAAIMKNRYNQMFTEGIQYVWFGMHRGRDGGGTLEHLHFQVYGSDLPPRDYDHIWHNERHTGLSRYNFQRLNGELTVATDEERSTETYTPYSGGYPFGMEVAYISPSDNFGSETHDDPNFKHFIEMSIDEVVQWLESVAEAVRVIENLPVTKRANGLSGYSLSFVVPPASHTASPMQFSIHPAKLRSVPFELSGALENPVKPSAAQAVLAQQFNALSR